MEAHVDEQAVVEATQEVLSRAEFQPATPMQSWMDWLWEKVSSFFPEISVSLPQSFSQVILIVACLALFAVIAYALFTLFEQLRKEVSDGPTSLHGTLEQGDDLDLTPLNEAMAEGKAKEALWHLHRLWLLKLASQDQLKFRRWKSNQAYLKECPHGPRRCLSQLSDLYATCVYGGGEAEIEALTPYITALEAEGGAS